MSSERTTVAPGREATAVPGEGAAVMPRTIIELVTEVTDRLSGLQINPNDPVLFKEAEDLAKLATSAIKGGHTSPEWSEYMLKFVDQGDPISTKQIARLLAQDDTADDDDMNRRRAYLLGNAICGGESTGQGAMLNFKVNGIDNGL
jgi:hypothetical protein